MDPAEAYCLLARAAIGMALSRVDLTNWWRGETLARHQHRLTQTQIDGLALAARNRVDELTGGASIPGRTNAA